MSDPEPSSSDTTPPSEASAPDPASPPRTLRRRKRLSLPKQIPSPLLLTKRLSDDTDSTTVSSDDPSDARPKTPEPTTATSLPTPPASPTRSIASGRSGCGSGYRSRPLYSVIRKRPDADTTTTTVFPSHPSIRSVSPSPCSHADPPVERSTSPLTLLSALDEGGSDESLPEEGGVSPHMRGHLRSMSGCSLSGETELRIALSRGRRATVSGERPEYQFRDAVGNKGGSLILTVKKIRHGIMSLVKSR